MGPSWRWCSSTGAQNGQRATSKCEERDKREFNEHMQKQNGFEDEAKKEREAKKLSHCLLLETNQFLREKENSDLTDQCRDSLPIFFYRFGFMCRPWVLCT